MPVIPVKRNEQRWAVWDSTRLNGFPFRDDDIIIGTWSKSGTTWMQQLLAQFVFRGDPDVYGQELSPWPEFRVMPREEAWAIAAAQQHRRFIKTHYPFDCVPYSPQLKYLFVGRDARDVAWSMFHHQKHLTQLAYDTINSHPDRIGPPFTNIDCNEREYYLHFLNQGYFPGFSPDLKFWPTIQGWWDARGKPNVMLLHYNNLKRDFEGEARKIAGFLGLDIPETLWPDIVYHCSIEHMRKVAGKVEMMDMIFEGGGGTLINKGTNGRWKDVLSQDEIAKCDKVAAEHLSPECADWLRTGQMP